MQTANTSNWFTFNGGDDIVLFCELIIRPVNICNQFIDIKCFAFTVSSHNHFTNTISLFASFKLQVLLYIQVWKNKRNKLLFCCNAEKLCWQFYSRLFLDKLLLHSIHSQRSEFKSIFYDFVSMIFPNRIIIRCVNEETLIFWNLFWCPTNYRLLNIFGEIKGGKTWKNLHKKIRSWLVSLKT